MKKIICTALALLTALSLAACGGAKPSATPAASGDTISSAAPSTAEKAVEIKIATVGNENHQSTIGAQFFKEKVEELSNGQINVTVYPNGALGGEREAAEGVKLGTLQMTIVTTDGALPAWVPETQVLSIPYLFANKEEAYKTLDELLQPELAPKFEAQGFKHLGFMELGFRHFTNNKKEVKTAEDMKGLSIRVQEAPIWFALIEKLGATATPVAFNELYTALQQGMVDGQENPITSIASSRFNEVQKYMTLDGHTYAAESVIINKAYYDGLTPELQKCIDAAATYAVEEQRKKVDSQETEYLTQLKDSGMVVTEPDLASFRAATEGLYKLDSVTKLVDPALVEKIMAFLK
ncbi:MAG TPA: TRAP transporter substrate-binding protein DctP [Clostridia bacterium]|nr:TRAP transporter substrate-binding protein DctP [Clostridia bacterium]